MTTSMNVAILLSFVMVAGSAAAQSSRAIGPAKAKVIEHWTDDRRAQAIPRDLVIDSRGLGYLKRPDGSLSPHGHAVAALAQDLSPRAAGGTSDRTPPTVSSMNPGANATIGASHTFSAVVTDESGVRSVTFKVQKNTPGSTVQSFLATRTAVDTWSAALQGFTDGDWKWWVEARDGAPKGGNTTSVPVVVPFAVETGASGGGGGGGNTITNAHWTSSNTVTRAIGRIYFEMPGNAKLKVWWGYVCSGTVVTEGATGRSIILTAAHCVYDDVNKAFARNVMFIPDQDHTSGTATDRNCDNDPLGCWIASFGVVHLNWTSRTFPNNVAWDYGYYVVPDANAHQGNGSQAILAEATGSLPIQFAAPAFDDGVAGASTPDFTHGLGYSASEDPKLMYCAEDMTVESAVNWWLPSCALSGGSSGGPWIQLMTSAGGPIVSLNSWGYTNSPGMAGPRLDVTPAACVFNSAKIATVTNPADGAAGTVVTCQ